MKTKDQIEFGTYVKERREMLGKTIRSLALEVGISPAYLSDIENGNRPAPEKFLDKFAKALQIKDADELHAFYDMAGVSQGGQHADINSYMDDKPHVRIAMRTAIDRDLTDADWQKLIELIKRKEI